MTIDELLGGEIIPKNPIDRSPKAHTANQTALLLPPGLNPSLLLWPEPTNVVGWIPLQLDHCV